MQAALTKTSAKDPSDADIVQHILAGDHDAFESLMRRYNRVLYRTARSILKNDVEAEDVLQDAYLMAYRGMNKFRGESSLATWLTRIVINEAIARRRKTARRAEIIELRSTQQWDQDVAEPHMNESSIEAPEQTAIRAEARRLIEKKIDGLPDAFRTVFMLRALEEMTVKETAACLDITEATVRTRYFRAKGLLREALSREIDYAFEDAFSFDGARCDRIVLGTLARLISNLKENVAPGDGKKNKKNHNRLTGRIFSSTEQLSETRKIVDLHEHQRWNAAEVEDDRFSQHDWRRLLAHLGEDPNCQGSLDTPQRVEKAWKHWASGYQQDPAGILKVFDDGAQEYKELIVVRNIPIYSHCEHHLAPFFGTATIGYTPNGKILGLSKLIRLVECFARRLQVQERLTMQVANALMTHIAPRSVGVIIRCRHMCMESRGIQATSEETLSMALLGEMQNDLGLRSEFLALAKAQK